MRTGISTFLDYLRLTLHFRAEERVDGELLSAYRARRDENAFAELVRRHGPLVFGVCQRVLHHSADAEDAFQATFVLLARHVATVDPHRPLASWLYAVAYRTAIKAKSRRDRRREVESMSQVRQTDSEPLSEADRQEVAGLLDREMLALASTDRDLILLCDVEGRPHRQVAEALRIPPGSVSRRLGTARERLRARLARRGVILGAGALALFLTQTASATVPAVLSAVAVRAALTAAGGAVSLSASVAQLAAAVQRDAFLARLKWALAAVFLVGITGAGSLLLPRSSEAIRHAPIPVAKPADTPKKTEPDQGEPVNGLSLVLAADRTELTQGQDGKIAPLTLRLQFRNAGKEDFRVKTDNLVPTWDSRLQLSVIGPDDGSVGVTEQVGAKPAPKPTSGFFRPLPVGKSRSLGECKFPGPLPPVPGGKVFVYSLNKPGKYRIRATYSNLDQENIPGLPGAWTGTVTSNELVVEVTGDGKKR
jgi:RNA polymerase sigma factor (sigma-70 family)